MKWHGTWLYGVRPLRTRRDGISFMRHQPCQRCKYSYRHHWLRWIFTESKTRYKKLVTHIESHASAECLLESEAGIAVYKSSHPRGAGIAQWLERRTRDRKVAGSNPCWSGGRIFFSRVNFLCWLLFRYPFHPRVTAVTRKRPRSSCQKCRWQVTAKHAYTLRMWLCMKWHGAWLYGVHRMRRDWLSLAADSCGTSHASAVSTPLRWIFKNAL